MSATTQIPVYEEVCVKTEQKLVGYRDPTDAESLIEEAFSSGVPSYGFSYEQALANLYDPSYHPPGIVIVPPHGTPYTPPAEVAIPGAIWLFAGALALFMHLKDRKAKRP